MLFIASLVDVSSLRSSVALPVFAEKVGPMHPCNAVFQKFRRLFLFVFCFVCVSPFFAQAQNEPTRSLNFWAYRVGNGNWSDIKFEVQADEVDTLNLGKFMKGRTYEYQGPAQLIFFREKPDPTPDEPDRVIRVPVAQSLIPSGIQEAILIFTAAPKDSPAEFSVYLVDADLSDFPTNSIRVFNATGVRLAGKVGRENRYFSPGISQPYSLAPYQNEGIPIAFLVETAEGPRFVFEKELEYARNRRVILLLEPPRRKGSYKIQATNLIEIVEP